MTVDFDLPLLLATKELKQATLLPHGRTPEVNVSLPRLLVSARLLNESSLPVKRYLRPVQTLATLLANKTQHCWAQHVTRVCTPCCVLLRVVATCWKLLDEV